MSLTAPPSAGSLTSAQSRSIRNRLQSSNMGTMMESLSLSARGFAVVFVDIVALEVAWP